MSGLITLTQAADRMGCTRQWVHYLIKNGRLKANLVGGIYILKEKDVDACTVHPRTKPANGHTSSASPKKQDGKKAKAAKLSTSKRDR